jgi:hypothetical protein
MKHALRVEVITRQPNGRDHVQQYVQAVDDEGFDPEHRTTANLAAAAWDELIANGDLATVLRDFQEPGGATEDDRIVMHFDGQPIADEYATHVLPTYFDEVPTR